MPLFFGISDKEADYIDPQQRVFLEVAWSAIEDAGYCMNTIRNSMTGVFVGRDGTTNIRYKNLVEDDPMKRSGTWEGILSSRLSYLLNMKGPAIVMDTACSSGLVAVHEACNALRNEECEMAIAGGVAIASIPAFCTDDEEAEDAVSDGLSSGDHKIRAFDKKSNGTVFGEGCAALLLKPLSAAIRDNDNIYGVIKGSAINCDGASNGITSPNALAQEAVIEDAWKRAKVSPETISYIETHGTGTLLGDPIEVLGITKAFAKYTDKKQFCGLGSVKTNIGHTVAASGCINIIKVLLSMKNEKIPPSIYFDEPNPHIDFVNSPIYMVDRLTEWKKGANPRRAGVSAFGFSGTNAHLILEEPAKTNAQRTFDKHNCIITLSARTMTSLQNIINEYSKFLDNSTDLNLDDVSYTANVGRDHFEYRVALIASSIEDFKRKIESLKNDCICTNEEKGIYYGRCHVVSDRQKNRDKSEVTESEIRDLTSASDKILEAIGDYRVAGEETDTALKELSKTYVHGANVKWNLIYKDASFYKVSLPTYQFDRVHHWGEIKRTAVKDYNNTVQKKHPLVESCIVESMTQSIYRVNFNLAEQWVLQEHVIAGSHMVSGTTYIEICKEVLRQYYKTDNILLENIVFTAPLIAKLEDEDIEVHIIVTKEERGANFVVASKHLDANGEIIWIEHARGTASTHNVIPEKQKTFSEVLSSIDAESDAVEMVGSEDASTFGPRWRCAQQVFHTKDGNDDVYYVEVKLADKFRKDLEDGFNYHPAMLDTAVNMIAFQVFTGSALFLPFSYKNMRVFKNLPAHFYSRLVKLPSASDSEIIPFNVKLCDFEGNMLAEIEEVTLKKVKQLNNYISNSYYSVKWVPEQLADTECEIPSGNVLIFKDNSDLSMKLSDKIKNPDNELYYVSLGDHYEKIDEHNYIVGTEEDDYYKLVDEMNLKTISSVYHFSALDFEKHTINFEKYSEELNVGIYSIVYLARVLLRKTRGKINFVMLADSAYNVTGDECSLKPANASYLTIEKTLKGECSNYIFKAIDTDKETDFDILCKEILTGSKQGDIVAYRNGQRYVEELVTVSVKRTAMEGSFVKNDGVYVITGGTGGLGIASAINLTDFNKCNICLIARTLLPERDQWDKIIEKNESRKLCTALKGIKELESRDCKVVIRYADVTDYDKMNEVFTELRSEYGSIHGVIHCAGVAGDGFLYNKNMEVFSSVINPKIYGALNIGKLTEQDNLDFYVMFSSIQSVFGGPGQGDYSSANAFLDSYASELRRNGVSALAINWPSWNEVGMAVEYNVADTNTIFMSLSTQRAINALNDVILYNLNNVIPGEINYSVLASVGNEELPFRLSADLERKVLRYKDQHDSEGGTVECRTISREELNILGKSEDKYTETEKNIAYMYALVLSTSDIDIYENFNSIGGDSMLAMQLLKIIENEYPDLVDISDIFSYPTVEGLSAYIDTKTGKTVSDSNHVNEDLSEEEQKDQELMGLLDDLLSGSASVENVLDVIKE